MVLEAFISGQDGIALCIEPMPWHVEGDEPGRRFFVLRLTDDQPTYKEVDQLGFQLLYRNTTQSSIFLNIKDTSYDQVLGILNTEWAKDRAQRLAIIYADCTNDDPLKQDAKEALDELLEQDVVRIWFETEVVAKNEAVRKALS